MVVRGEVVGRGHHGVGAEVVKLPVELSGVYVELDVDVDGDQPRDLREYPVVEGRDVEHVVVVLVRVGDAQLYSWELEKEAGWRVK